jgi:hypothetical protein
MVKPNSNLWTGGTNFSMDRWSFWKPRLRWNKRVDYTDKKDPGQCPDAGATYVKHRVTETGGYFGSLKNLGPIPKGATPL